MIFSKKHLERSHTSVQSHEVWLHRPPLIPRLKELPLEPPAESSPLIIFPIIRVFRTIAARLKTHKVEHPRAASFKSQYQKRFGKMALPTSSGVSCRIAPDTDLTFKAAML